MEGNTDTTSYLTGDTILKSEPYIGQCQCCSSDSGSKSMFQPYDYEGNREIYSEMLRDCFSVELLAEGLGEEPHLICESCVRRLRESCYFRRQVLVVQDALKEAIFHRIQSAINHPITGYKQDINYSSDDDRASIFENVFIPETEFNPNVEIQNSLSKTKSSLKPKSSKKRKGLKKKFKLKKRFLSELKTDSKEDVATEMMQKDQRIILCKLPKEEYMQHRRMTARKREELATPYKLDKSMRNCPICNEEFTMHKNLIMHMNVHYPNFVCYHCGKAFAKKRQLQAHLPRHSDPLIPCKTCGKKIKRYNMRRHIMTHTGNLDIHRCPSCPERFKNYGLRQNHITKFHNEEAPKHKCKLCPKVYCLASTLSTHVRKNHLNERKHCCTECDKNFFEKIELENHMRIHTGDMFKCEVCSKGYPRKSKLTAHMKIHEVVK